MINTHYKFRDTVLSFTYPKIMGIVNVTPDSFSDGGKFFDLANSVDHALKLIDEGADIIDVGGESTKPGSDAVSLEVELNRTIPVIKKIRELNKNIIISIDTTKSEVARIALESGADIINDISGLTFDAEMINVAKQFNAGVVIMHIKGNPKTMQNNPTYKNVVEEINLFLQIQSDKAKNNGVEKIIIDPGIGFGKTVEDNFKLIKNLNSFQKLGYPIMVGLSRKSFIGKTLNLNIDERDLPTVIMETVSVINSARIIRTHNVKYCMQMVKLAQQFL